MRDPRDLYSDNNQSMDLYNQNPSMKNPQESYLSSFLLAPQRILDTGVESGLDFIKKIPDYIRKGSTEVPGLINLLRQHPGNIPKQAAAGITELGHKTLNIPYDIANFASNKLNLLPQSMAESVPHQKDISDQINQAFGKPQYAGEELIRGGFRNFPATGGAANLAWALSPHRLTNKAIAKNIGKTTLENKEAYSGPTGHYKTLFNDARGQGFGNVMLNPSQIDIKTLKKWTPAKYHNSTLELLNNPALETAQDAISDLGKIVRKLENQKTLTKAESKTLTAAQNSREHIRENMFKNSQGQRSQEFSNRHNEVQSGYANDVIPYTTNPHIKKYLSGKLRANELVQNISKGEFIAQKGHIHPELDRRKLAVNILKGAGLVGGVGTGISLADAIFNRMRNS
jgi:hypothetical protein